MKLSFIIPAFNAEAYIGKCLDSIAAQPFDDYEIIIIDDGSTDRTAEIIAAYQKGDARIRVVHQTNAGQGAARNAGLALAGGDYIWFVDSDDWLLPSVLPRLAHILEESAPDVLVINFEYAYDDRPATVANWVAPHLAGKIFEPRSNYADFASVSCWQAPPWRLITRRALLVEQEIKFATGVFYEDHPFAIHLMLSADRVYVYPSTVYSYYQRATSTTKNNDKKVFDFLKVRRESLELFKRFGVVEDFAPIVLNYVLPRDFYFGHVGPEYQAEFLRRLNADLAPDEIDFVRAQGNPAFITMLGATRAADPSIIAPKALAQSARRWRDRLTPAGAKRFLKRKAAGAVRRFDSLLLRLRERTIAQAHSAANPSSAVDRSGRRYLQAGEGVRLEPFVIDVRVNPQNRPYLKVGDHSHVSGTYVFERGIGEITIGSKSSIGGGCLLICTQEEGIHIGDSVMLSWGCTVMDSNMHSLNPDIRASDAYDWKCGLDAGKIGIFKDWTDVASAPIRIKDNAWLGFDVSVSKGVTIGRGAIVGSRSHVTRDVPDYCIFAGSPAKFVDIVPRTRWTWEELIQAQQANPAMQETLKGAYLSADIEASLRSFRGSGEFYDSLREIKLRDGRAKRVVDIGGGNGVMSVALALEGYDVTLVEPEAGLMTGVAGAKKLLDYAAAEIDETVVQRLQIVNMKIGDFRTNTKFDVAYCRQIIHHFEDPVKDLTAIRNLLSEGGIALFLREHAIFDDADLQYFLETHPFNRFLGNEFGYHPDQYRKFIEEAGFSDVKTIAFADSRINYHPHSADAVREMSELEIAGRPYSFIARARSA